ncbi:hypothetical protein [Rubellimicrobium sp. CFH 75288]|uniref:hypothetical protein n=1 Tax=Rubellimicrobium sp. CFH 75288 TaxID=2697034 RepID=UPI001412ACE0|nr:hypothetical protein [Rubellimicrobium sp. CFH 75288]NAZ37181.1 hypothetical protein [Rubellimicrobium sp. CFH 75288]
MTDVRDAFAAQFADAVLSGRLGPSWRSRIVFADLAAQAYAYADAMMAARGRGEGGPAPDLERLRAEMTRLAAGSWGEGGGS